MIVVMYIFTISAFINTGICFYLPPRLPTTFLGTLSVALFVLMLLLGLSPT